jgi:hypothetical protein
MASADNVARLRQALDAWNSVDHRNEYYSIYAPDAVVHAHGVRHSRFRQRENNPAMGPRHCP